MSRVSGVSEERLSVFKTRSKLGTHLSALCRGDERQSRPCPLIEPKTCGAEARYITTRSYSVKKGQIAKWIQRLQEYDVEIRHRKGSAHGNADTLSRRPCPESCKFCSRIEKKFGVINPIVSQVTTPSTSALDPWSDESVRKDQLADFEIKAIIEFKELSKKSPAGTPWQFRWRLFWCNEDLTKVPERFYWNNVRSDVENCFRICDPCAARKGPRKRTRGRLLLNNVGAPFERIALDILSQLPRSSDGNNNILHWISRFGVHLQLHSDQGKNFDSAVCKRLSEILAIDKTRTTALHPQSDGMVERFNRTILNSVSLLVSSNQQDCDKKLPFSLLAYRSAVHETTDYPPSQMLFGCDLRLLAYVLSSRPSDAS
ncbi:retrovirus-related Pol polyprotein from transposon 412 [Trichonephila clavipes]|nr:retrovirus-related Pol polyprotein from transposon 412 [Trichonephila clavipes]